MILRELGNEMPHSHELDNEGCLCELCQNIIIKQVNTIKHVPYKDTQSGMKGKSLQYLSKFLLELFVWNKQLNRIKVCIPQICVFQKGAPTHLISKRNYNFPLRIINNKQKLNGFEILNFFIDGYVYHNRMKQNTLHKNDKLHRLRKQYLTYVQMLKNECIVLIKYVNGSYQMMNPCELTNIFKWKERYLRTQIDSVRTMIRIRVETKKFTTKIIQHAYNEIRIITEEIKEKDYLYHTIQQETQFENQLKGNNYKDYLEYISLKLILLYSYRNSQLIQQALFKYMSNGTIFYLIDINVYSISPNTKLWGEENRQVEESQNHSSPTLNLFKPLTNRLKSSQTVHLRFNKTNRSNSTRSSHSHALTQRTPQFKLKPIKPKNPRI